MATSGAEGQSEINSAMQSEGQPVLIVAALKRELAAIARDRSPTLALLDTGEGPRNAERALRAWLDEHQARAVINVGLAGALSASLEAGDIVIAREIRGPNCLFDATASPLFQTAARLPQIRIGTAVTVDEIVCKATDKRRLVESVGVNETAWVDMESTAIAAVCDELQMPYLIVRAISDRFDEDLPVDFNRCRDASGRVSSRRVVQAALARPRAFKGLLALKRRADLCADNLAAFIRQLLPLLRNSDEWGESRS
jgi:adenosylhomocysteine nucleosidase